MSLQLHNPLHDREENEHWIEEVKLEGHSDWVRDVAWSPTAGLARMKIASSSQVIRNGKSPHNSESNPEFFFPNRVFVLRLIRIAVSSSGTTGKEMVLTGHRNHSMYLMTSFGMLAGTLSVTFSQSLVEIIK